MELQTIRRALAPIVRLVPVLALAAALAGCASAGIDSKTIREANARPATDLPVGSLPAVPVIGATDYRIGPLDVLDIEVYGIQDFTRSVRVSAAGQFTLPLVGQIDAGGKSARELEEAITAKLSEQYLVNPQVSVFVKEYNSQRVTVEGAVAKQGIVSLTSRTSLLQLVAMQGGLTMEANQKAIVIYRHIDGKRFAAAFDIREIRAGRMVDPEVIADDVVVVDYSGSKSAARETTFYWPVLAMFMLL